VCIHESDFLRYVVVLRTNGTALGSGGVAGVILAGEDDESGDWVILEAADFGDFGAGFEDWERC